MVDTQNQEADSVSAEKMFVSMNQVVNSVSPELQNGIKSFLDNVLNNKMSPKQALGLTDAMLEGLYGQSYRLFNAGKYSDAGILFRLLVMLDPLESRFSMGLAGCLQMNGEYEAAGPIYNMVGVIDAENPLPLYHASDCWIKLGNNSAAIESLEKAVERAGDKPEYKLMKDRCLLTLEGLKSSNK